MMTSSNGNIFRVNGHLCREFTGPRSPVNSLHKGQWRGALMFSLICARINGSVNNREAGDLRWHRPHYDVVVMESIHGVQFLECNSCKTNQTKSMLPGHWCKIPMWHKFQFFIPTPQWGETTCDSPDKGAVMKKVFPNHNMKQAFSASYKVSVAHNHLNWGGITWVPLANFSVKDISYWAKNCFSFIE